MNNNRLTSPCYWKAQNRKIQSVCGGWLGGKPNPVNVAWHRQGFIDLGIAPFTGGIWECRDAGLTSHCCSWRILLLLSFSWINAQWNLRLHQQNGPSLTLRLGFNREGSHSLSWRIIVKPFKMKSVLIWESFGKKKHTKISRCGLTRRQILFPFLWQLGKEVGLNASPWMIGQGQQILLFRSVAFLLLQVMVVLKISVVYSLA